MLEHLAISYDLYCADLKTVSSLFLRIDVVLLSDQNFTLFIYHVTFASNSKMKIKIGNYFICTHMLYQGHGFKLLRCQIIMLRYLSLQYYKTFSPVFSEPHEQRGPLSQVASMHIESLSLWRELFSETAQPKSPTFIYIIPVWAGHFTHLWFSGITNSSQA